MKKSDWSLVKEAEKDGRMTAMTSVVEHNRTELNERLSKYFRTNLKRYQSVFSEEDAEDVLDNIAEYLGRKIDFPINDTDVVLIPITENLSAKMLIADEYYGSGDYEKYIDISFFMINDDTTENDVNELINFVQNVYS